jgi:hypothetical protein
MMSGEDVVREVRAFAPMTRIGAQVAYDDRIALMLEAGAHSAYTRRVPPADVAARAGRPPPEPAQRLTGASQGRG